MLYDRIMGYNTVIDDEYYKNLAGVEEDEYGNYPNRAADRPNVTARPPQSRDPSYSRERESSRYSRELNGNPGVGQKMYQPTRGRDRGRGRDDGYGRNRSRDDGYRGAPEYPERSAYYREEHHYR